MDTNESLTLRVISLELSRLTLLVGELLERNTCMSAALDRLTQEVEETKTAVDSVIALVTGLADQLREIKDDPAKIEALADELDAQQAKLGAAVTENTPQG